MGAASGSGTVVALTLAQPLAADQLLVVMAAGGATGGGTGVSDVTLVDSLGTPYLTAVSEVGTDTSYSAIFYTYLTSTMASGTVITATFDRSTARNAIWALVANNVAILDQQDGNTRTSAPSVTTQGSVTSATGLVVGATICGSFSDVMFNAPAGFTSGPAWNLSRSSGIFGYKVSTSLSGTQTFAPTTGDTNRDFNSVVAVFKPGTPAAPSLLQLSHTDNSRDLTVSWSAGAGTGGVGGCELQYRNGGNWSRVTSVNCDAAASAQQVTLPSSGWISNVAGQPYTVNMRLARRYDGTSLATFTQTVDCSVMAPSATSTSSMDEDCDGNWDNIICSSYAWAMASFTCTAGNCGACVNSNPITSAPWSTCSAGLANQSRYTDGVLTTEDPSMVASYTSATSSCTNPGGVKSGAVRWTCTGSGCTFN